MKRRIRDKNPCSICLSLPAHRLAEYPGAHTELCWRLQANKRDAFDHTPLHFAAASERLGSDITASVTALIEIGADILAVNTCGETFLHTLLGLVRLDELRNCFPLFRFLERLEFPFCQRDYEGRTPLHVLLERCQSLSCGSFEVLGELIDIMKPEIESMDNLGYTISYYFSTRSVNMSAQGRGAKLLSKYRTWHNLDINFLVKLGETVGNWQIWKDWVATAWRSTWVDLNGDTALLALIKSWSFEDDESLLVDLVDYLVKIGAQIHSRDRSGNTALAIASIRGFRLVVTILLGLNASAHSCNYCGATILMQGRGILFQAQRRGDDRFYASVLSCIVLLIDSGAEEFEANSRGIRQYVAPWVTYGQRRNLLKEQCISEALADSGFL
jgi:ankyrin repeat protein